MSPLGARVLGFCLEEKSWTALVRLLDADLKWNIMV